MRDHEMALVARSCWDTKAVPRLIFVLAITALLISFLAEDRVTGNWNSHIGANI